MAFLLPSLKTNAKKKKYFSNVIFKKLWLQGTFHFVEAVE